MSQVHYTLNDKDLDKFVTPFLSIEEEKETKWTILLKIILCLYYHGGSGRKQQRFHD